LVQIRTGVNGFADRYLTTRPRDLDFGAAKIHFFLKPPHSNEKKLFGGIYCHFSLINSSKKCIFAGFNKGGI
ncbi:MAG: hypothetical protein K5882_06315, partial [Bacteroidales bacterium]|nr:hypothetical protein [Bacteroidales bacterium]